jgi:hypothetical protein
MEGKHPSEILDYSLDYDDWLVGSETLSTVAVTVASGLTLTPSGKPAPAISGTLVTFWVGGGTHGQSYAIEITTTTSGGRTLVADASITVTDPTP